MSVNYWREINRRARTVAAIARVADVSRRGDEAGVRIAGPGPSTSLLPGQPYTPRPGFSTDSRSPEFTANSGARARGHYGYQGDADAEADGSRDGISTSRLPGNAGNRAGRTRPGDATSARDAQLRADSGSTWRPGRNDDPELTGNSKAGLRPFRPQRPVGSRAKVGKNGVKAVRRGSGR